MPEQRPATGAATAPVAVFRLPALTYLVVLLLLFGTIPLAFTAHGDSNAVVVGWQTLFLLIPVVAAVFIARTATIVDGRGLVLRAAFGRRRIAWDELRGLSVSGSSVYAVVADGSLRLPCVSVGDLGALSRVSAGRLPTIDDPTPKFAPQRRRRR